MNDDSNQNVSLVGIMAVAVAMAVVLVMAVVCFVLTTAIAGSIGVSAEMTTSAVAAQATVAAEATATAVAATAAAEIADAAAVEPTQTPTPLLSSLNADIAGRLVVVSADNQLITINPDGSDLRQLTRRRDNVRFTFPAWSPDNRYIAAIGNNPQGIYVLEDAAESEPQPIFISDSAPIYLYWSPDSSRVSFITPRTGDSNLLSFNLVQRDGSQENQLLAFGVPFYWDWNSDGSELLFNTSQTTHAGLAFLNTTNGEIGEAINGGAFFASPDISADDAYIAYSTGGRSAQRLIIENRAGEEQNMIRHSGLVAFAWSPTVNQLAYTAPRRAFPSAFGALWIVEPQGEPRLVVDEVVVTYYWSPDGSKIAYFTLGERGQPELEANQARTVRMSNTPIQDNSNAQLELSVLDVATGESTTIGRFLPGSLFIRQFVPFFDQYARSHSLWSPDSAALVMPVQENGETSIYLFAADGSLPTKIIAGEIAFWSR